MVSPNSIIAILLLMSVGVSANEPNYNGVTQFDGPITFQGPYRPSENMRNYYKESMVPLLYGAFHLEPLLVDMPNGEELTITYEIRETHYPVNKENTQVGMRLLPYIERPGTGQDLDQPPCEIRTGVNGGDYYHGENCYPLNSIGSTANGTEVFGSEEIDIAFFNALPDFAEELGVDLSQDIEEKIFAPISYSHPDYAVLPVGKLSSSYKPEMSLGHTGAYYGSGITANSPYGLHDNKWMWDGDNETNTQPANMYLVGIKGVDPNVMNLNMYVTLRLLNLEDVSFPDDYKKDYMFDVNLKNVFSHYRGWLDRTWVNHELMGRTEQESRRICRREPNSEGCKPFFDYLTTKEVFATYCAEHITHVINVGLNLPQNLKGYKQAFGGRVGRKLFRKAKRQWAEMFNGAAFPEVPHFEPLYKRNGVQGLPTDVEEVGLGLAWNPVTNAELAANFIETYANWKNVGSAISGAVLLGFKDELIGRTGLDDKAFISYVNPIIAKMIVFDVLKFSQRNGLQNEQDVQLKAGVYLEYLKKALAISMQQQEVPLEQIAQAIEPVLSVIGASVQQVLVQKASELVEHNSSDEISTAGLIAEYATGQRAPLHQMEDLAYSLFRQSIQEDMARARSAPVVHDMMELARAALGNGENISFDKKVQYYSPPATLHRISTGMFPGNDQVIIKTFGTAVHAAHLDYITFEGGGPINYTEVEVSDGFDAAVVREL